MKTITFYFSIVVIILFVFSASTNGIAQTGGNLTFKFTTSSSTGYTPKHVLSVWVESSAGTFIKTLRATSKSSDLDHLATWTSKSSSNVVDAVTSATNTTEGLNTTTWLGSDIVGVGVLGNLVPDGPYKVWVEFAWGKSLTTGKFVTSFSFVKGPNIDHQTPANYTAGTTGNLTGIDINWLPSTAPTISTSALQTTSFNPGATVNVPFTKGTGSFYKNNTFTAQLSDASGNFANPVNIGNLAGATAGTIAATIPQNTANGTGYRIRVVANQAVSTGTDNGTDLTIDNSVGIQEQNAIQNIIVYPNPTKGAVNITLDNQLKNANVKIINVLGETVIEQKNMNGNTINLNISEQPDGVYFLEISENGTASKVKIIKK